MEVVDTVTTMPRPCLGGDSPSAPRTGLVFPSAFSAEHQAHCLSEILHLFPKHFARIYLCPWPWDTEMSEAWSPDWKSGRGNVVMRSGPELNLENST